MSRSSSSKWLFFLFIVALIGGLFWYLNKPKPVAVTTAKVESGLVERTVANTRVGTVEACQRSKLSLSVGGQIAQINVTEGQAVKQGTLLVELWNEDLKAILQETQLAARSAELDSDAVCINARNDRREADRLSRLASKKLASEEATEHARAQADAGAASCAAASARKEQAAAHVSVAAATLAKTRLVAPFDGIVAEITGEIGEYATPSPLGVATPPTIDLLTDNCHTVVAPIDEVDAAELAKGDRARISFDAYRGRYFDGTIIRIAPYVLDEEKQARTVEVEVAFKQPFEVPLFAGYSADVEIILEQHPNALRIPTEALLEEKYVLVYQEGESLQRREVKTGISNWRYTEVLDGLQADDEVVTSVGRDQVKAGVTAVRE